MATYTKGVPSAELVATQGAPVVSEPTNGGAVPVIPEGKGPKGPATPAPIVTVAKGPITETLGPVAPFVPQGKAPKPVPQGFIPGVPQGKGPKLGVPAPAPVAVIPQGKPPKQAVVEQGPIVPQGKGPKAPLTDGAPVAPAITPQGKPPKAAIDGVPAMPQGKGPKPVSPAPPAAAATQGKPPKPITVGGGPAATTQGKPAKPLTAEPAPFVPQGKGPKPFTTDGVPAAPAVPQGKGPKPAPPQTGAPEGKSQNKVEALALATVVPQGPVLGPVDSESESESESEPETVAAVPQDKLPMSVATGQTPLVPNIQAKKPGRPQENNGVYAWSQIVPGYPQNKAAKSRRMSYRIEYRLCPVIRYL